VLSTIVGVKRADMIGWRKLHNEFSKVQIQ
jgi:hypothetical protein